MKEHDENPQGSQVSILEWDQKKHSEEILQARLKFWEMKRRFAENPPEMLTLEQIRELYRLLGISLGTRMNTDER
ncbi:MAG: hypothetical protein R2911_19340 [Caldilineaceae bacterium]